MVDDRRARDVAHGDHGFQGNHFARGVANPEPADVFRSQPIFGIGLHVHLPVAIEQRNVVDVGRTQVDLKRLEHVVQGDSLFLGLDPIHVYIELWLIGAEAAEEPDQPRLAIALLRHVGDCPLQRHEPEAGPILYLELEATGAAQAVDGRGAKHNRLRFLNFTKLLS